MKHLVLIPLFSILFSCSESTDKAEKENTDKKELGNFKKTEELPSCLCSELKKDTINDIKLLDKKDFTGVCFSYYPNDTTKVMEEIQYLDGKIHGYYRIYSATDGKVLTEDQYQNGNKQGVDNAFKCDCDLLVIKNENSIEQYYLKDKRFTGLCEKYSADGKMKIMDMEFIDGLRDGNSIYYDQYGSPITADVYEEGVFVNTIVFTGEDESESNIK